MKFSIIVFCHGAIHSKKNFLGGWLNVPLSSLGEKQAKTLAIKLKHERISVGFCSDLLRSKQVLAEVLVHHSQTLVVVDHRLRGRHFGEVSNSFEGVLASKVRKESHIAKKHYFDLIVGGENLHAVSKRVFPFMNDVLHFMKKEKVNVAISAHKESYKLICEFLEGLDSWEASRLEFDPTGFKKFVIDFS